MAIEPLARRLGVTKGSFYWHFADRDALWSALLDTYEREGTEVLIAEIACMDPRSRLIAIFAAAWERIDHLRAQRALFASARPDARETVARVHDRRRRYMEDAYLELGFTPIHARNQAAAAYASYVGAVMLSDQEPFCTEGGLRAFVAHAETTWIPA